MCRDTSRLEALHPPRHCGHRSPETAHTPPAAGFPHGHHCGPVEEKRPFQYVVPEQVNTRAVRKWTQAPTSNHNTKTKLSHITALNETGRTKEFIFQTCRLLWQPTQRVTIQTGQLDFGRKWAVHSAHTGLVSRPQVEPTSKKEKDYPI